MYLLMIYSLKAGACLAVFYLFFKLLLSRETFHRLNRVVLLSVMILSFVLPFCVITIYREVPVVLQVVGFAEQLAAPVAEAKPFPWEQVAGAVFLLGAVATLCTTLCSLTGVLRLIRRGRREHLSEGVVLVLTERPVTPFSWGRYIVLSEQDAAESGREIIIHERAHLRLHHSWDLLATDIAGCLQWFNPAMWLLRRELRAIHEYEADEAVLDSGVDAKHYQLLLIKKAAGGRWYSVANSFNHSKLKNRITMMLQKRSSRWAGAKALLVLPLVGLALGAFAETAYVFPEDKGTKENITIPAPQPEIKVTGRRDEPKTPQPKQEARAAATSKAGRDTLLIRIPEAGDASGKKQPIFIVDGKEVGSDVYTKLDPNEIASVNVLKGESAKKMYPERYENGVVVITTTKAQAANVVVKSDASESTAPMGIRVATRNPDSSKGEKSVSTELKDVLIIVDGVRSDSKSMERISPDQIESITILKDKSSVEIYGPDGAKGVVVIKTKGAKDKVKEAEAEGAVKP